MKNSLVYYKEGSFAAWPANNGVWNWDDEVLMCFTLGTFQEKDKTHSINDDEKIECALSRSMDGGLTWQLEDTNLDEISTADVIKVPLKGINF